MRGQAHADEAQRVSSFCAASQKLVNDIRSKDEMSPLVADELVKEYKLLLEKGYTAYQIEAIRNDANDFKAAALSQIDQTERYFKDDQTEATKMVFADYRTEADEGARLLFTLGPCIIAPHKDLDSFLSWSHDTDETNQQIAKIKQELQHAKDNESSFSWPKWFNLNLWLQVIENERLICKMGEGLGVPYAKSCISCRSGPLFWRMAKNAPSVSIHYPLPIIHWHIIGDVAFSDLRSA